MVFKLNELKSKFSDFWTEVVNSQNPKITIGHVITLNILGNLNSLLIEEAPSIDYTQRLRVFYSGKIDNKEHLYKVLCDTALFELIEE